MHSLHTEPLIHKITNTSAHCDTHRYSTEGKMERRPDSTLWIRFQRRFLKTQGKTSDYFKEKPNRRSKVHHVDMNGIIYLYIGCISEDLRRRVLTKRTKNRAKHCCLSVCLSVSIFPRDFETSSFNKEDEKSSETLLCVCVCLFLFLSLSLSTSCFCDFCTSSFNKKDDKSSKQHCVCVNIINIKNAQQFFALFLV